MNRLTPIDAGGLRFDHIIGTGGIGSGIFFALYGHHTLGRNESRMAALLPYRDFCKQHIILHYVAVLLGARPGGDFRVFPIGKVGDDETGAALVRRMQEAGMDTAHVGTSGNSTLFSVCYQYPDHTGGNITTGNSASSEVTEEEINRFFRESDPGAGREIVLAAPEVPVPTRIKLLEYGRQRGSFNVASVLSSETAAFRQLRGFELADLLALNIDEAGSIANTGHPSASGGDIAAACVKVLTQINPGISLLVTDGGNGSYCYTGNRLTFTPALNVPVKSTAGAGDTFLAGVLAGLCCGLPLPGAVELGTLLAALAVTSHDTIHPDADARTLYAFATEHAVRLEVPFTALFADCIVSDHHSKT